jgi:uncharacterized protein
MLKDILSAQKREKEKIVNRNYVERNLLADAERWRDSELIKIILGPRRAGKSVFAISLLRDLKYAYINFDDPSLVDVPIDLEGLLEGLHGVYGDFTYVLFDEIQNLPKWELYAGKLYREGYNLVLTGSNAKLLSQELSTHLTGRHIPIEILPFSFNEYLKSKGIFEGNNSNRLTNLSLLSQFARTGGYPEVVVKGEDPREYLSVLFDSILFKDVVQRHKVRYTGHVAKLANFLLNNVTAPYSFRRLATLLNFKSDMTLEKYIRYLEDSYAIFSLSAFSFKTGERIRSPKKTYLVDNGFISAKTIGFSPDNGRLLENMVFTELLKKQLKPNKDLFYFKTRNNYEVDFLVRTGSENTELIQVCYDMSDPDTLKREVRALTEAAGELGTHKLTILTWNEKSTLTKEKHTIEIKPVLEWLLSEEESN